MRILLAVLAAAVALAGCGAPDELSRDDALTLSNARDGIDAAAKTRDELGDPAKLRKIRSEIRRIVATGSLEAEDLDEFGLASLGELAQVVPSVVETDADGVPTDLDRPGLRAFLRYAGSDPERALLGPVRDEVAVIERVIEESEADGGTEAGKQSVDEYLRSTEKTLRPGWPALADRLSDLP